MDKKSNFDGVYRCDIMSEGIPMTWDEYKHIEAINKKIASNPWNYIVGLMLSPWYILKMLFIAFAMGGVGNKFTEAFIDDESKLSKTIGKISKKLLNYESYMDEEYHRIMEVPFEERHPERYTEEYIKEHDRVFNF